MNHDALKLTTYFGERDRAGESFLAEALLDVYEQHGFTASVLLRGTEGFGSRHRLQTQRLLTLSEDLPLVTVAVDARERIQAALDEVAAICGHGLITLERARLLTDRVERIELPDELHEATKLTIYCGRQERVGGRPAFVAVVDLLHRRGIAGATVLLGVDGTSHGARERARFFARNAEVPLMVIAVGEGRRIAEVLPELGSLLRRPLMTLERVRVCKRDGKRLAEPRHLPAQDESGLPLWHKLMVHSGGQARHGGRPLHVELIRRLRDEDFAGATSLRAIWGFHGEHRPHGDKLLSLARHVPVLTAIVDRPDRIRQAFAIVDEVTAETGLVTSEMVPAARAASRDGGAGELRLARQ